MYKFSNDQIIEKLKNIMNANESINQDQILTHFHLNPYISKAAVTKVLHDNIDIEWKIDKGERGAYLYTAIKNEPVGRILPGNYCCTVCGKNSVRRYENNISFCFNCNKLSKTIEEPSEFKKKIPVEETKPIGKKEKEMTKQSSIEIEVMQEIVTLLEICGAKFTIQAFNKTWNSKQVKKKRIVKPKKPKVVTTRTYCYKFWRKRRELLKTKGLVVGGYYTIVRPDWMRPATAQAGLLKLLHELYPEQSFKTKIALDTKTVTAFRVS